MLLCSLDFFRCAKIFTSLLTKWNNFKFLKVSLLKLLSQNNNLFASRSINEDWVASEELKELFSYDSDLKSATRAGCATDGQIKRHFSKDPDTKKLCTSRYNEQVNNALPTQLSMAVCFKPVKNQGTFISEDPKSNSTKRESRANIVRPIRLIHNLTTSTRTFKA